MSLKPLLELDARLSDRLRVAEKPGSLRTLSMILAHSGDSWFWGLGLAILYMFPNPASKEWALTQFAWIAMLAVLVMSIKFTIRRQRPPGEWGAIYRSTDPHSFPSGHAARAFLIAVIALGFGPLWLGLLLMLWAFSVALARVAMGVHYVSDIVAGAVVGIVVGFISMQFNTALFAFITRFTGALW